MLDRPQILQTVAQPTAVIRLTIPRQEIQKVMGPGYRELMAAVAAQRIAPAGPWFSHHLRMDPDTFDFELGVPVTAPIAAAGRVQPGQLPAATVARTVYRGAYEGLGAAWGEFNAWIAAEGHTPAPNLWECYVAGPESSPDPAAWRTELNRPLIR
jgi:effector-binding domain-containing protein